jgi:hypothetical protein
VTEQTHISTEALAKLLGVDRNEDFPARRYLETEREEAELLLSVSFNRVATTSPQPITTNNWQGTASTIDTHPIYRWPVIEEVAVASRQTATSHNTAAMLPASKANATAENKPISTASVILGRRSAQRFDASHTMPAQDFINMLDALLPNNSAPWNALASPPRINILLFVHRVAGINSGLYLLTREPRLAALLNANLNPQFLREPVANIPAHLNLQLLTPAPAGELHRAARSLHCHQDIAANACFTLGMLAEYDGAIANNPSAYRDLHHEAGLIGQVLYLQAEMAGLRGTGIGCFFDDPIHELLGLTDNTFQTIYHFTVGLALEDTRIENIPTSTLTTMQARTS